MKNEGKNSQSATLKTNENKVPSILVNSVTKCEHEKNKKQVKFNKAQSPKAPLVILSKSNAEATTTTQQAPTTVTHKKTRRLITRTASWSEGSTENTKSCVKPTKKLETTKTNTHYNSKSKVNGLINKPQKARRNSLQSPPIIKNEKQNREGNSLQVKAKSTRSRSKSPNIVKKQAENTPSDKNDPEKAEKTSPVLSTSISEKLQKFDELLVPRS